MKARHAGEPGVGRCAAREGFGARVHDSQFEMTSTLAEPRVSPPCEPSIEGSELPLLREDHDAVGLSQAEVQPGSIEAIALQDRELGSRLPVGEPLHKAPVGDVPSALQRSVHGSASVLEGQPGRGAGPREGVGELIARALHVCPAGSQHRNAAREAVRRAGEHSSLVAGYAARSLPIVPVQGVD